MKKSRLLPCAVLLASTGYAQVPAALNRMDLDNGGDRAEFLNDPSFGSDPLAGDYSGDLYWKVFPAHAIERASGAAILWGTEQHLFDLDWSDFSVIWAYQITPSFTGTDQAIRPILSPGAPGVFVPQIPNSGLTAPGPEVCPKPGYVGGWILSDVFADTATGSLIPLMQSTQPGEPDYFRADGTVDWSFVHFFPGDQSVTHPSPNGCGGEGNATLQWFASTDVRLQDGGENQGPATLQFDQQGGLEPGDRSRYGGIQFGGPGGPSSPLLPEFQLRGADLSFFMQGPRKQSPFGQSLHGSGPTLSVATRTQYFVNGALSLDVGLAGLEVPIGWNLEDMEPALKDGDFGNPGSTPVTVGVVLYDQTAKTDGSHIGLASANVDLQGSAQDLLIDSGFCFPALGGGFCLNPTNSIFNSLFFETFAAFKPFEPDPQNGNDIRWVSPQFPIPLQPTLIGVTLGWQGWSYDLTAPAPGPGEGSGLIYGSSNVYRMTMRDNENVD